MTQPKQNNEAWLSLVERCVRDAEVACSNHVASTFSRSIGNVKFPVLFSCPKTRTSQLRSPICLSINIVTNNVNIETALLKTTSCPASCSSAPACWAMI